MLLEHDFTFASNADLKKKISYLRQMEDEVVVFKITKNSSEKSIKMFSF